MSLVSVADYVLSKRPGPTVSNLSSSRALRDVTEARGCTYTAAAVGEVNVTAEMKRTGAVIGGEGNGGVIKKVSALRESLPRYSISKNRIELSDKALIDRVLAEVKNAYASERITDIDGVKIDFDKERMWVHLRRSNTEPIIRVYSEAEDEAKAEMIASDVMAMVKTIIG